MTVVGEAFVAISPVSTGFGSKLEGQLAGSGFATNVEKQMANAGVLGGNAFTKKIQGALSAAGISGGAALGVGITLGAVAGLAKIGEEFQKAEHQIAQQTGATGKTLTGLADTVTRSFRQVPVSLGAAATAVDELFRRGVPLGPQLDQLAKQELFLAKVTKEDLGSTVEATTGLMQKFNVPLADQSRELDVLFKAYQASGKGLSELTSNLQTAGGILQSFGFSLDKSAALLASLERAGVNLGPALAGLRLAFGKITAEGGDPQKVLASLIKEFTDGTPKTKALADAIQLFGKRSGAELSIAISKGKFDVDALLKSITDGKDGIIATGLATLTLGDQIRLFANNAAADLSKLGTSVLQGLESTFANVGPPILDLVKSFAQLVQSAAPLGVAFVPVIDALRVVGPSMTVLATGVHTLAEGFGLLPGPVVVAGAALAAILFTSEALTASLTQVAAKMAFVAVEFAIANPEIAIAVAAIAALGIVAKLSATSVDPAIKAAKEFGLAVFDAGNKTGVFKEGLSSTNAALTQFLADQSATGKLAGDISDALKGAGSNVKLLSSAVSGGDDQWKRYKASLIDAAKAADPLNNNNGILSRSVQRLSIDLDTQRRAFQLANKDELTNAVVLGQISPKLEIHIKNLHRSKDGTVDFGAAVDDLNKRLASQATAHDKVVLAADSTAVAMAKLTTEFASGSASEADVTSKLKSLGLSGEEVKKQLETLKDQAKALNQQIDLTATATVPATAAYGALTREIARGTITQHDAEKELHAMGFSLDGAGIAFSNLQSQVKSFIDGAVSQLPTVGQAISDFAQGIIDDQNQLDSDKKTSVDLHDKLDKAIASSSAATQKSLASVNLTIAQDQQKIALGSVTTTDKLQRDLLRRSQIIGGSGKASDNLRAEIEKNNAAIIADNKKLADDNNPNRFTQNLLDNSIKVFAFTANLQKLVSEGFAPLAAELAKQGPVAAGGLAAGLAAAPAKAAIAEKSVELGKVASDNFRKFLKDNAPELIGTGAKQGLVIGKAIADGITKELLNNFPFLRQLGITTGDELLAGAKEAAGKGDVTAPLKNQVRLHIPEFRGLGVPVGSAVNEGVAEGAGRADVMGGIAKQLSRTDQFSAAGLAMGAAIDEGISAGVILNQSIVGGALVTMTAYGTSVVANQWRISSPSQVFAAIGREVPAGVAAGINSNVGVVGVALSGLHGSTQSILTRMAQDGYNVGLAAGDGIARGIRSQFDNVGNAVLAVTEHGVAVAKNQWKITSPSKVFAEIGTQVGAGLAEGIATSAASVGSAASRLATATTETVRTALAGVTFDPTITPEIHATLAPIPPPTIGPVTIDAIPPVAIVGTITASVARVPDVVVPATLSPLPTPSIAPVTVQTTLGPIAQPHLDPVVIDASIAPPAAPPITSVVIPASLAPVAPPRIAPVVASLTLPPIPPVVVPTSLSTVEPPHISPVTISATVAPHVGAIDATPVGKRLGATIAAGVGDGLATSAISDRLTEAASTAATSSSSAFRDAGTALGGQLSSSLQNVAVIDPDKTPGQGLVQGFDANAGVLRSHMSELAKFLDGFTFVGKLENQFAHITDQKTTAGFVTFGANLVDMFHKTFEKITVDAGQLQTVLDALTEQRSARADALSTDLLSKLQAEKLLIPKFAPPQPPSSVTFAEQAQSIQVPRPVDRADAQTPRPAVTFNNTFNEKIDPLHVASELAWQLL